MLITSPRGNLPGLPAGNWDASPVMQQTSYSSSMAPRTMLDMLVQKEMGVLAAVNNAMQSRGKLMPYLDNWPTLLEFVGERNLRHSYNNKCCNVQHKFDKPVMG
jgi:hypothetical protein